MDSLQASYRDDEDEEPAQHLTNQSPATIPVVEPQNDDVEEPDSADETARELKSSPKDDVAHDGAPDVPQSESMVPDSISDSDGQERDSPNDAAQEAQPEATVPASISENDVAHEAQRNPMVSDSITLDVAAQETKPQNDTALEALPPEPMVAEDDPMVSESVSEDDPTASDDTQKSPKPDHIAPQNDDVEEEDDEDDDRPPKKQKPLSSLTTLRGQQPQEQQQQPPVVNNNLISKTNITGTATKKSKKKNNNLWVARTTRKGKRKNKTSNQKEVTPEETVLITPVPRFPDKGDDNPEMKICLSKVYKAEKVELSEDRLTAGSTKGYRMVRATRGVVEGAWYYEIKVVALGETGHTRLGWSTEKGDLQAPVGYDGNSFGYRDIDGSKVHKALREKYGEEGYKEGDVIGFYISLPEGGQYEPKPPHFVWYKGQRYVCAPDAKDDPPKVVPGSEISFFKNGLCQGVAFKDLYGGRYYPAASMYTLPNQPNCVVKFNFGPDFECFPEDFGERPVPSPLVDVPYHGFDSRVENGVSNEKKH